MNIINIENLTKTYGDFKAVDNISFSAEKGSLIGFLGVNGAGKSTTINMMSTLLSPTSGKIEICGLDISKNSSETRKKIGIVYQNNMLDDLLTVKENLICRGILHGSDKKQAQYRLKELSSIFNLDDIMKKKYHTLSGGQKRRCEIVSALMHTPEILILDEPTTGLDPATRQDVWNTIEFLRKNTSMTVFLTTHYMEEASKADKIIIISKGKIITQGIPHQLKEKYSSDCMKIYCNDIQKANIISQI
nr:ABC transporter ATP-binding protein [Oscillospiraceae bacterium]